MNSIKFTISDTQYLQVTPEPIGKDDCEVCANSDIDYVDTEKNITIRFGYKEADNFYGVFCRDSLIEDLINNKLPLDKKITPDLGIAWNNYMEGFIEDTDIDEYHIEDIDIDKYYFVGNSDKQIKPYYDSWLYNDENGNIIFEITPFYTFHYETNIYCGIENGYMVTEKLSPRLQHELKKTHPDFIPYKKFMKDYKPTLKIKIPKETLMQWNNQAKSYNPVCHDSKTKSEKTE